MCIAVISAIIEASKSTWEIFDIDIKNHPHVTKTSLIGGASFSHKLGSSSIHSITAAVEYANETGLLAVVKSAGETLGYVRKGDTVEQIGKEWDKKNRESQSGKRDITR